jgi:hypothetical protein
MSFFLNQWRNKSWWRVQTKKLLVMQDVSSVFKTDMSVRFAAPVHFATLWYGSTVKIPLPPLSFLKLLSGVVHTRTVLQFPISTQRHILMLQALRYTLWRKLIYLQGIRHTGYYTGRTGYRNQVDGAYICSYIVTRSNSRHGRIVM